ncbi:hypothetical protein Pla110_08790 [Polystyrenella longa]|uniref:Uncharacterized protein n=1 Tax=Polystyrenella longa TaxID=2528007 RepID=A0A518CJ02_9PLAN|nr:hypothetical protein [Polystyrenella longa]QDU79174.1 hypothetical protein Pla110_08790 [Polystyrenella longa]
MSAFPTSADLSVPERLHQLPDEQFAQILIDEGWLKPLSVKANRQIKSPLGEQLAQRIQREWIKSNLIKRAHRLLPVEMVAWSAESLLSPVLDVSPESQFLLAQEELTQLTGSSARISSKKRLLISIQLSECLTYLGSNQPEFLPATSYQLLSMVEILIKGGAIWSPAEFWELYRWVTTQFLRLLAMREENLGAQATPVQVLILEGELPWLSGLLFSKAEVFKEFGKSGQKTLKKALKGHLDNDGTPQAVLIENFGDWLAPLVRSQFWGAVFDKSLWKPKQSDLYDVLLERAAQLCHPSGRLLFSAGGDWLQAGMLQSAMRLTGFANDSKPLKYVTQIASTPVESRNGLVVKSRKWGSVKNSISSQSDWAELAVMRSNWALDADTIAVAHHQLFPKLEMSIAGNKLFQGDWEIEVRLQGRKRKLSGEWECSCWYSDREIDYLELSLPITEEIAINRQIVLSREDHFAMLIESVSQAGDQQVEIYSRLPLATNVELDPDQTSREWRLNAGTKPVRIFPLDEPQFKVNKTDGELRCENGMLEQKQNGIGAAINVLFLDWHPRRNRERVEWRKLSVTENRRLLPTGEAFAARIRLKNRQWLFYRSLKTGWEWPRAVLGLHTNYETVLGRFDSKGNIVPLVNVE